MIGRLLFFALGLLVGAAAGAALAALLAPQSGPQLKQDIQTRIAEGKAARARAEAETTTALRQKFRQDVNDPNALSSLPPAPPI